ncbi:TonB-dependent receptor plug domain-containing protein [Dyella silvae]|uniref:TonB-dependent receptor plug domain-containing protein n=1 Tax=Dyella silvae TaxID=2994424 RepID=UPI0022646403|nr:TonB-dependent receptor [Dyella silvae]
MQFRKIVDNKLTVAVRFALSLGAFVAVAPAFAEDAPSQGDAKKLETITVTGSRIRSVDIETSKPVFTMTQADIQKTGLVSVGDILQNLTVAGSPTFSKASVLTSNSEEGGQYINMRNLGENRTLVLVNGKRWATSLDGYTDMSTIPAALIERIDVLKDGASAVYGSDAIAGVVNIILRDHYNGAEASAYVGENEGNDGTKQAYSFTLGSTNEKTSLMFSAAYNKENEIWAKNREITRYTYGPNHAEDGLSATGPWGRFRNVSATGGATGTTYVLNHTGSWDGKGVGEDSRNLSSYHKGVNVPEDYYNPPDQMMWSPKNELKTIFATGSHHFNDYVTFKTNAMYAERDNTRQVAGYPLNSLSQPTHPVYISGQSYYNPEPGKDLFFYRRTIEIPRVTEANVKQYHWDAAFEGAFELGQRTWNWDVGFDYNKYDYTETNTGNLNLLNLRQAVGPSFVNSNGVVQCGSAASPISLDRCVPFNILGGPSASTPQALAYINARGQSTQQSLSKDYTANITGGLFDLPAGEVGLAAGYEHRQISGYDRPDQLSASGWSTDLAGGGTNAKYNTDEFYVEVNVPVLRDLPGARELSFDIASRYSDYSNFGHTTNNKYSILWKPIDDLLVRGTLAKGFRAPTLGDTFGGGSQTFDYYTDPCDAKFGSAASNASVAAACRAAGVPANFRQTNSAGLPISSPDTQGTSPFNAGVGNSSLVPETSLGRTAGLVYSPSWVPGLDVSLDWYDIRIVQQITAVSANYVLNQCYVSNVQQFCNDFQRDPVTHAVVNLNRGNLNLGSLRTSGYDFGVHYRLPEFGYGKFAVNLDSNYLKSYDERSTSASDIIGYAGQWKYPRVRANLGIDWSLNQWGANWTMRYYGAFRDQCWDQDAKIECNQPNYQAPGWSGVGANRKGASTYHDMQVRYSLPWNGTVSFGIRNVFDKQPTITYSVDTSSTAKLDPTLDIDRYFYLQYTQKF